MGTKYTVTAGVGNLHRYEYKTNYLLVALYKLFAIKVDYRAIYWKQFTNKLGGPDEGIR